MTIFIAKKCLPVLAFSVDGILCITTFTQYDIIVLLTSGTKPSRVGLVLYQNLQLLVGSP